MKFYPNSLQVVLLTVGLVFMSLLLFSCKSSSQNISKNMVSEAYYYKSFGGQGRSRTLNFEIVLKEEIKGRDQEFWLHFKSSKVKLRKSIVENVVLLKGHFTEHKKRRDEPWNETDNLFAEIPFNKAKLIIKDQENDKTIVIDSFKSKKTVYHP